MSKKKILISTQLIEVGGVERSLLAMLERLDTNRYEIDLFIYNHSGSLLHNIPSNINLLREDEEYSGLFKSFSYLLKRKSFKVLLVKLLAKIAHQFKVLNNRESEVNKINNFYHDYLSFFAAKILKPISTKDYDVCIAYLHPNMVETQNVCAKKYIGWIHTDFSRLNFDTKLQLKMWRKFDHIVGVSKECSDVFVQIFPEFKNNVVSIENMMSEKFIMDESLKYIPEIYNMFEHKTKILSVGRYSYAKNFDNIPQIASILKQKYSNFIWLIVGFGGEKELIQSKIEEFGVSDCVFLIDGKDNPYPYFSKCDIYIQPSRFEGKSVTVREAQFFCKPVIITNYTTANAQVINGYDGLIVNNDNAIIAQSILELIRNKNLQSTLVNNCKLNDYTNTHSLQLIEQLIEV